MTIENQKIWSKLTKPKSLLPKLKSILYENIIITIKIRPGRGTMSKQAKAKKVLRHTNWQMKLLNWNFESEKPFWSLHYFIKINVSVLLVIFFMFFPFFSSLFVYWDLCVVCVVCMFLLLVVRSRLIVSLLLTSDMFFFVFFSPSFWKKWMLLWIEPISRTYRYIDFGICFRAIDLCCRLFLMFSNTTTKQPKNKK